jgi:hypothetical protein
MHVHVTLRPPKPTRGYDIYWSFASERQKVYRRRLDHQSGPLTDDPVIAAHRFTNAYRASDRVSQYLIANVIYDTDRPWVDTFARILIFKIFNRVDTWCHLQRLLGEVSSDTLMAEQVDDALESRAARWPIYSAAYIMPPPRNGTGAKFRRHLELIRSMIRGVAHERIAESPNMQSAFAALASYDSIGPFLAYQFLTDLNYSPFLSFSETEFVAPGPGALRGLRKCIADPGDYGAHDVIRWVMDAQEAAFADRGLEWTDLWGRPLQLIDIQNLFCEVDKYTRAAHPELSALAPGKRIKQRYRAVSTPLSAWFPPKWGVNDAIPARYRTGGPAFESNSRPQLFPIASPAAPTTRSS